MRFVPLIAIAEVKSVIPQADPDHPLGTKPDAGTPGLETENHSRRR